MNHHARLCLLLLLAFSGCVQGAVKTQHGRYRTYTGRRMLAVGGNGNLSDAELEKLAKEQQKEAEKAAKEAEKAAEKAANEAEKGKGTANKPSPTPVPPQSPTRAPTTAAPTPEPTPEPTPAPTPEPTPEPTPAPTPEPTAGATTADQGAGANNGAEPTEAPVPPATPAPTQKATTTVVSESEQESNGRVRELLPFSLIASGDYQPTDVDQMMEVFLFGKMTEAFENVEWVLLDVVASSPFSRRTRRRQLQDQGVDLGGEVVFLKEEGVPTTEEVQAVQLASLKDMQSLLELVETMDFDIVMEAIRIGDQTIYADGRVFDDGKEEEEETSGSNKYGIFLLLAIVGCLGGLSYWEHIKVRKLEPLEEDDEMVVKGSFLSSKDYSYYPNKDFKLRSPTMETTSDTQTVKSGETRDTTHTNTMDWNKVFSLSNETSLEESATTTTTTPTDYGGMPSQLMTDSPPRTEVIRLAPVIEKMPSSMLESDAEESLGYASSSLAEDPQHPHHTIPEIPSSLLVMQPRRDSFDEGQDLTVDLGDMEADTDSD